MAKPGFIFVCLAFIGACCLSPEAGYASGAAEGALEETTGGYDLIEWLWGEVASLGAASLTIRYLDYEDGTQKQMVIRVNEETVYENVSSLEDIRIGDTLSIDYVRDKQGDGVASQISREHIEDIGDDEGEIILQGDITGADSDEAAVMSVPLE